MPILRVAVYLLRKENNNKSPLGTVSWRAILLGKNYPILKAFCKSTSDRLNGNIR